MFQSARSAAGRGAAGLTALILALGLWGAALAPAADSGVVVRKEEGPAGHSTIGLDEDSLGQAGKEMRITFAELMQWEFEVGRKTPPPDQVKKLNDRKINITGFMYPLQEGKQIQYFCIMRTTQTCCYGPRPQYNQFIFVEADKPTLFHRLAPVTCSGLLKVEPNPDEGYIYRLESRSCQVKQAN